ncbi:MAG: sulfotransferase [Methyloprofundus sp.]|nr:sulfotransferase [Methyloprofundus sp.]
MQKERQIEQKPLNAIFIGGAQRSGTTMLGSILGGAKGCVVTPESQFKDGLPQKHSSPNWKVEGVLKSVMIEELKKNFRYKLWELPVPDMSDLPENLKLRDYSIFLERLVCSYAKKHECKLCETWVDHTPGNLKHVLTLLELFPNAKFIHLVRDPRGVAASIMPLDWGADTPIEASVSWSASLAYGLAAEQAFPDRCIRVYYEDLLERPELEVNRICKFCNLEFTFDMLTGRALTVPAYTKKQHKFVGARVLQTQATVWKERLDQETILQIEQKLSDFMVLMGYKPFILEKVSPSGFLGRLKKLLKKNIAFISKKVARYKKKRAVRSGVLK